MHATPLMFVDGGERVRADAHCSGDAAIVDLLDGEHCARLRELTHARRVRCPACLELIAGLVATQGERDEAQSLTTTVAASALASIEQFAVMTPALDSTPTAVVPLEAPAQRFRVHAPIGRGGMADVFRGLDSQTQRVVAIKRLRPALAEAHPDLLRRFQTEGVILAQLRHPNVIELVATVSNARDAVLVLELAGGGSLRTRLAASGVLRANEASVLMRELSSALDHVHRSGFLHRDVKPDNMLLALDGTVRLADFGLACELRSDAPSDGSLVGTLRYLSPEALRGHALDPRTDLWALGISMFEMVTGAPPFGGKDPKDIARAILHSPIPDLQAMRPDLSDEFVALVTCLLAKQPEARPASAGDIIIALGNQPVACAAKRERGSARVHRDETRGSPNSALPTCFRENLAGLQSGFSESDSRRATPLAAHLAGLRQGSLHPPRRAQPGELQQ